MKTKTFSMQESNIWDFDGFYPRMEKMAKKKAKIHTWGAMGNKVRMILSKCELLRWGMVNGLDVQGVLVKDGGCGEDCCLGLR